MQGTHLLLGPAELEPAARGPGRIDPALKDPTSAYESGRLSEG